MAIICYKTMQMDEMPETAELLTFTRTVESGSISRAALELAVPRPTVGRRLARLEEKLGVRLLRRTTRAMVLTDAGTAFYAHARTVLAALRDAEVSVKRSDDAVRGLLRVSIPPMTGTQIGQLVARFLLQYPEVRVELDSSSRHVDLIGGGYDVAIRASTRLPPGLIARRLGRTRMAIVGAPDYLARVGTPRRVTDLVRHACLVGFVQGEHPMTHWPKLKGGQVRVEPVLASNDLTVLREAALMGRGLAMLPLSIVYDDVRAGRLVVVLPERMGGESQVAVVYAEREFVAPAVRAFVDAVVVWAKDEPLLSQPLPACPSHTPRVRAVRAKTR